MAVPVLSYGSESWVTSKKDKDKIQAAEMRFRRRVKGCTRADRIRNVDIRAELNIYNINSRLEETKEKWEKHIDRMTETRIPKLILQYQPKGKKRYGLSEEEMELNKEKKMKLEQAVLPNPYLEEEEEEGFSWNLTLWSNG
jgi:hypothetical protein